MNLRLRRLVASNIPITCRTQDKDLLSIPSLRENDAKMSFICMIMKNNFQKKGFALGLVLKQRLAASRKRPIRRIQFTINSTNASH